MTIYHYISISRNLTWAKSINTATLNEKPHGAFNGIIFLWSQILQKVKILSKTEILKDIHSDLSENNVGKCVQKNWQLLFLPFSLETHNLDCIEIRDMA